MSRLEQRSKNSGPDFPISKIEVLAAVGGAPKAKSQLRFPVALFGTLLDLISRKTDYVSSSHDKLR